jgi:hypothetical protein
VAASISDGAPAVYSLQSSWAALIEPKSNEKAETRFNRFDVYSVQRTGVSAGVEFCL